MSRLLLLILFFICLSLLQSSCDKLPIPQAGSDSAVEVEPLPPAEPEIVAVAIPQAAPEPTPRTPEQIITEFQQLAADKIQDHHLEELASVEASYDQFEEFHLANSRVTDDGLQHLAVFHNLKRLDVSKSSVRGQGLSSLTSLPHLEVLRIDSPGFDLSTGATFKDFQNLRVLSLRETAIADSFYPFLVDIPNLEELYLDGNRNLRGQGLSALIDQGKFGKLKVLSVSGSDIGLYGLLTVNRLKELQVLNAGACQLNLKAIEPISKSIGLVELNLSSNPMNDEAVQRLKSLRNLKSLNLSGCQGVTDRSLPTLRTMKQLSQLNIANTSITQSSRETLQKALPDTKVIVSP